MANITGVNPGNRYFNLTKQQVDQKSKANKSTINGDYTSDKLEISAEAKAASATSFNTVETFNGDINEIIENKLEESKILSSGSYDTEDSKTTEARRKLYAMKIAQRIAKGDNVPMQDHRFLAEFDSALYKTSLRASLTADNDDPETHDSLADELLAIEDAIFNRDSKDISTETDNSDTVPADESIIE